MKRRYVGALDQGTTSTRFLLFGRDSEIVASHQIEHRQIFPRAGWVEHDPETIWKNCCRVIDAVLQKTGVDAAQIHAVGITNQRETTVVWDRKTGKPFANAIVWQDTRTKDLCQSWIDEDGIDRFRKATGLPVSTYFSASKLVWLLKNIPELRQAAERGDACFGTIDTWLAWRLSGGPDGGRHVTDPTNASRTLLYNLRDLRWDPELLRFFEIPEQILPRVLPSVNPGFFCLTDGNGPFQGEVPVGGILGDQQAALFGQAGYTEGDTKNTYGTGCFTLTNTGESAVLSRHGLISTIAYQIGKAAPVYALEGSVAIAGALVQWFRDNVGLIERSSDIEKLAAGVPDNGGVYFVPAFSGLFAPHWDSSARGLLAGMTHSTNAGHLARAILEATAFQTREIFDAMKRDSGISIPSLRVDGGMVENELLMQFQADILGIPVLRPKITETTALGACYAAGLGAGVWSTTKELSESWRCEKRWERRISEDRAEEMLRCWKSAVQRSKGWLT